jgi:hypothetical protein
MCYLANMCFLANSSAHRDQKYRYEMLQRPWQDEADVNVCPALGQRLLPLGHIGLPHIKLQKLVYFNPSANVKCAIQTT